MFRRERNSKRGGFKFSSNSGPWAPTTASNQSVIGDKAVRTKGNPWGDADGGKGHIADMASDAWKGSGY